MATNKHETYVRFEEKDHRKLAYLASKEHRSTNSLIVHFALAKLEEYEAKNGEIIIPKDWYPDN
jgi:hypothetical protein